MGLFYRELKVLLQFSLLMKGNIKIEVSLEDGDMLYKQIFNGLERKRNLTIQEAKSDSSYKNRFLMRKIYVDICIYIYIYMYK